LLGFAAAFVDESLQMDFSAFYTAGEALNRGLSPYDNNIYQSPPVWDGVNIFVHSRFLYPPPAAELFRPLAFLPYFQAKALWTIVSLACIGAALIGTARIFRPKSPAEALLVGILVTSYFPLLTELERGQIDSFTLVLLVAAFILLGQSSRPKEMLAGILIAFAALLKLHVAYIAPFLWIRGHRWGVAGFSTGAALILLASLIPSNGKTPIADYLLDQMPRISNYGRPDHADTYINEGTIRALIRDVPEGQTVKDQRAYRPAAFEFLGNATLARPLNDMLAARGWEINQAMASLGLFLAFLLLLAGWEVYLSPAGMFPPAQEFIYWQAILSVILLSAPLTHVMNTVWLLPSIVIAVSQYRGIHRPVQIAGVWAVAAGLIAIALPGPAGLLKVVPLADAFINTKYLIGEFLVFAGWLTYLGGAGRRVLSGEMASGQALALPVK
jgi:hypothetical protein